MENSSAGNQCKDISDPILQFQHSSTALNTFRKSTRHSIIESVFPKLLLTNCDWWLCPVDCDLYSRFWYKTI